MENSKYIILIAKHFSGELTEGEKKELDDLLKDSTENEQIFSEYKNVLEKFHPNIPPSFPDTDENWRDLEEKLELSNYVSEENDASISIGRIKPIRQLEKRKNIRWSIFAVAASLLIIIVYQFFLSTQWQVYNTQYAQKMEINLPDHSKVILNAGSEIKFLKSFSESERVISLSGQAFFMVTKDKRPFIVQTENAQIKVLGTEFDVYSRDNLTKLIVKEGVVSFESALSKSQYSVILKKNETSILLGNEAPMKPETVDADYIISWMDNRFVFYKTSLKDIVDEMQRRYDVTIKIKYSDLGNLTLSGSYEEQRIESTLSALCQALNLKYEFDGKIYHITKK